MSRHLRWSIVALLLVGCESKPTDDATSAPAEPLPATEEQPVESGEDSPPTPEIPTPPRFALPTGPTHPWDGEPGSAFPEYAATDLSGAAVRLADLQGRPVLLNFWATWCVPCRTEFPELTALQQRLGDAIDVVGVSLDSHLSADELRAFAAENEIAYTVWHDPDSAAEPLFAVPPLPGNFVFDAEGRLVYRAIGAPDGALEELMGVANQVATAP